MSDPEAAPNPDPPVTARTVVEPRKRSLKVAAGLALFGLGITLWHLMWPSPLLFTLFMFAGQGAFAVAILLYGWTIFRDLRRRRAL